MKIPAFISGVVFAWAAGTGPALADINVFACEPEWAALARELGGEKVQTFAATSARQDPHHIRARPSLIARVRRADLIFCSGAGLEVGWLPILLQRGARAQTQPGQVGHLLAADYVSVLGKPTVIDRSLGDVHPEGNPHVHLSPDNVIRIGAELSRRLTALDRANMKYYESRASAFRDRWTKAIAGWKERARALAHMPVIVHHTSFTYLIEWLKLETVGTLEPKPGLPPTSSHLESILRLSRAKTVKAILRTPYDPDTASKWLSAKAKIPALELPYTVGGHAEARNLESLFERTLSLLERANHDR